MKKLLAIIALLGVINARATDIGNGKTIFTSRCTACHTIPSKLVGPALKDVDKRHSEEWIVNFVHSSQTLVKNGDTGAVKVFNANSQIVMPDHQDLKEADIKDIIAYIKDESAKLAEVTAQVVAPPVEVKGPERPISASNYWLYIGAICFIILIVFTLYTVINSATVINKYRTDKLLNEPPVQPTVKIPTENQSEQYRQLINH